MSTTIAPGEIGQAIERELEIGVLEQLFEHELVCEMDHSGAELDCSIKAVANCVATCRGEAVLWCENAVFMYNNDILKRNPPSRCGWCEKTVYTCWRIVPL